MLIGDIALTILAIAGLAMSGLVLFRAYVLPERKTREIMSEALVGLTDNLHKVGGLQSLRKLK